MSPRFFVACSTAFLIALPALAQTPPTPAPPAPPAAPAAKPAPPASAPAVTPQTPQGANPDYRPVSAPDPVTPQPVAPAGISNSGGVTPPGVVPAGMPYLPPTTETMLLNAPTPTISPSWGLRVGFAGDQILVTGPERAAQGGNHGQLANWHLQGDAWIPNLKTAEVQDLARNDLTLQKNASAKDLFVTVIERRAGGTLLALFEPKGNDWAETTTLTVSGSMARDGLGGAIATDGSTIIASSVDLRVGPEKPARSTDPELFVWSRVGQTWNLDGFLKVPQTNPSAKREAMWFGTSLAVDGGTMAIGSPATIMPRPSEETPISGQATVWILRKAGQSWLPEAELAGVEATPWPCFGIQVALEGDVLAVRAADPASPTMPGRVWAYHRTGTTWKLAQELIPVDSCLPGRAYGNRMTISKGRIIISDPTAKGLDEKMGPTPGMVFVFELRGGTWQNTHRLMPKAPVAPSGFGQDITANWPWVVVARPRNETLGIEPGGAYVFKLQ